jgi:CRISPR-associated endoribonuclease Cas6
LYLSPLDKEFNEIIRNNLIKKYKAFYGVDPLDKSFYIKPINKDLKMIITKYKSFMIKSWEGKFEPCGSIYLLKIAYDAGI